MDKVHAHRLNGNGVETPSHGIVLLADGPDNLGAFTGDIAFN